MSLKGYKNKLFKKETKLIINWFEVERLKTKDIQFSIVDSVSNDRYIYKFEIDRIVSNQVYVNNIFIAKLVNLAVIDYLNNCADNKSNRDIKFKARNRYDILSNIGL